MSSGVLHVFFKLKGVPTSEKIEKHCCGQNNHASASEDLQAQKVHSYLRGEMVGLATVRLATVGLYLTVHQML